MYITVITLDIYLFQNSLAVDKPHTERKWWMKMFLTNYLLHTMFSTLHCHKAALLLLLSYPFQVVGL